ncbi:hypothetical protein BGZ93_010486 [Podila epicladia]|nr:hypothetical protein BGZ93_010486 [Podila epicladia]
MSNSRAAYPANNRQIPEHLRFHGTTTIYCYGCNQSKPCPAFSESQLKKAATRNSDKRHHVLCKSCTPVQNTSLKCVRCNKTQRKLQERATCIDCRKFIDDDDSEDDLDIEDDPEYYHGDIRDVL